MLSACPKCRKPYDDCTCEVFKGLESAYDKPNAKSLKEMQGSLNKHYKANKLEPFDIIEDMGDLESFCRGNAIKYLMRYKHKGSPVQDLEKAKVYIDKLIEMEK